MRRTLLIVAVVLGACGGEEAATTDSVVGPPAPDATETAPAGSETTAATEPVAPESGCADVIAVEVNGEGDASYRFDVTVRSSDTGWDKYADAWEVRSPDGEVLGVRVLTHPHETEQPFTRSLGGVAIDPAIQEVVVAAHDSASGFCGQTATATLP